MQRTSGVLNFIVGSFLNYRGNLIETIPGCPLGKFWLVGWTGDSGLGTLFEAVILPSVTLQTNAGHEISSKAICQSPERVMGVGRSVVKLDNLFPGNVSMDAMEIKFSVISLPPQPTMSSDEIIFEGLLALDQKHCSNSWEIRRLLLMWYRQTWPVQAHRIYLEWFRHSRLWQHMLGYFL